MNPIGVSSWIWLSPFTDEDALPTVTRAKEAGADVLEVAVEQVDLVSAPGLLAAVQGRAMGLHTAKRPEAEIPQRVTVPDFARLLPEPIQQFTTKGVYDLAAHTHLSFAQGAGHGGSHPHMVHERISAIHDDRTPFPDARRSANWTCVGLCAHESALKGGRVV